MKKKPAKKILKVKKAKNPRGLAILFKDDQEWFLWMAGTLIVSIAVLMLFGLI